MIITPRISIRWWTQTLSFDADLVAAHAPDAYHAFEEGEVLPVVRDVHIVDALMRAQFNRDDAARPERKRWSALAAQESEIGARNYKRIETEELQHLSEVATRHAQCAAQNLKLAEDTEL
jgi:hypothetical protein